MSGGAVNVRYWPRLCKNSPNLMADGTALHIDYKIASDEILVSHLGIGIARERLQFTTGPFHFAFLHSLGRKRPLDSSHFRASERPLSGKAAIQPRDVLTLSVRQDQSLLQYLPYCDSSFSAKIDSLRASSQSSLLLQR